jgi:anti-sigma regulatory factor (Ser/Thr protein kinase)
MVQEFVGVPVSVGAFRDFVAKALVGLPLPVVEDSELVASELATNAITHSRSRLPGGVYTGRVEIGAVDVLIEVVDQGADDASAPEALIGGGMDEHGRGLFLCATFGELKSEITTDGGRRTAVRLPLPAARAEESR